ncbi:MAG: sugar ABC transporter substrate-binding protein [Lactobacillus sp.]|jgi:ABC-type glycerol-3-phosphate transport system substrate-binding protein|nr:sugar ABC transporter substrate-binding protein [Lactobacillus sp.]
MKKFFKVLVSMFIVGAVVALSGCASKSGDAAKSSSQRQTLQMLVPGYDAGYLKAPVNAAIKKYERTNPDVKIKVVSVGWDELNSKIVKLYQAGQSPDILMVGSRSLRQFAEAGVLEDLTPYMTKTYEQNRIQSVMATGQIDNKQYGIPLSLSSRALFYRSDLIDHAPANWDELLQTAKTVSEKNHMYGFAIPTDITSGTDELLNFIYQGDGQIVNQQGKFVLDSPQNIETLTYLKKFKGIIPDPVDTARGDQVKLFKNGDLAMFISGGWEKEELDKGAKKTPYKVAELPAGKQKAVTLVTDSYTVSAKSKHKKAAFKFIQFLGQADQQRAISKAYNWLPVTKAEQKDARFQTPFMQPFVSILNDGISEPKVPNWDTFNKSFTIAVQKTLTGAQTPAESLKSAQQEVQK